MNLKIDKRERPIGGSKAQVGIININACGAVGINVFIQRILKLEAGQRFLLARDMDSRNDWYASFPDNSDEGYKIRFVRKDNTNLGMVTSSSRKMLKELLDSVKAKKSASFYVATGKPTILDGKTWYRLLTATPRHIK